MKTLKLSAVALAVAASGLANAADIQQICGDTSGCRYSFSRPNDDPNKEIVWNLHSYTQNGSDNSQILGNSTQNNLQVNLKSQHYQNLPVGSIKHTYRLLEIEHSNDNTPAHLTVPTGTTMKLSNITSSSWIIGVRNTVADIAKGVTLTTEPSYAESNHLADDRTNLQEAIRISGNKSVLNTSADIILNSSFSDSIGLHIEEGATAFAKEHKIQLNNGMGVLVQDANSSAILESVTISGNGSAFGAEAEDGGLLQLKNSHITLSNNQSIGVVVNSAKAEILDNSNVTAGLGIFALASAYNAGNTQPVPVRNVVNITNSTVNGRDSLFSLVMDEVNANSYKGDYRSTLNAENSKLYGKIAAFNGDVEYLIEDTALRPDLPHNVDVTLKNSDWTLNGNSEMEMLAVAKSNVTFEPSATFKTLTVNDTLIGADSVFHLNTDLANEKSDQIVLKAAGYGEHSLDVKDSGNEPKAPNGKVTLVKATQASEATFKLFNRDYVDAGAYRYRLHQQGYDWILSNNANEKSEKPAGQPTPIAPVNPTTSTDTAKPVVPADTTKPTDTATTKPVAPVVPQPTPVQPDDHPAVQKMLSETSNTLVSLRQAQLQLTELELSGIHQRLGKLKTAETGNVWVRNHNARQERKAQSVAADSLSSGFKQDTTLLQIGADTAISDNWRAGGFVGTSRSDIDFNGEYGKGKLKGVNLGLYATFQAQNGIYADNIVKFDRLRTSGDGVESQRYNGYTLSSEIGKAFAFGEGWTVTPQAQLAWTHLSSGDNVESLSALTSRAGVRVSKAIALANGNITPFIEVNGIHTHNRHSQVHVNQYAFDVKGAGSRIETAAGVSANFANHRLGVQLSTTHGSHLKQPLAVQVNYRYSW